MTAAFAATPLIGLICQWDVASNCYRLASEYPQAVASAGGIPVLLPLIPATAAELVARLDAIILCGSASDVDPARYGQPCRPEVRNVHAQRDETDFRVLEQAFRERKPVLGICFGIQSLNVYLGGTLLQHIPDSVAGALEHNQDEIRHAIHLAAGSRLAGWAGDVPELMVNSTHHQAIENPGRGLRVVAQAPDGVIEAVEGEYPGHFVVGVQWHPERIWQSEPLSARLFAEFVQAARRRRASESRGAASSLSAAVEKQS